MRIIKLGIISLLAFALTLTFISFFFPSTVRISKAINIGAPATEVIAQLQRPSNWHPAWDSAGGSTDSTLLSTVISNEETDYHFREAPGSRAKSGWKFLTGLYPDSVTVQWYMDFKLRWYPWEKFSSLLFENSFGPRMEKGLNQLKQLSEKKPLVK
ncbi:MAG: hypothetical protein NTW29_18970 [Bacteroidetes bacterium]|nr:hypothetical protein [Bacteroidota bacterium]